MKLKWELDVNRRKFLKSAGAGTIALGSLPSLAGKAWAGGDDEQKGFHFVVVSFGPAPNRLQITGDGTFDVEGNVEGGGSFDNFLAVPPPPDPFGSLGSGTWKARKFVSFTLPTVTAPGAPDATHGVFQGGILKLRADFHPVGKQKAPATRVFAKNRGNADSASARAGIREACADRLVEPPRRRRPPGVRGRAFPAPWQSLDRGLLRPGQIQANQRHVRALGR